MELIKQESDNILFFWHPELLSYRSFSDIDSGRGLVGNYADFFRRETGHHEDDYLLLLQGERIAVLAMQFSIES